MTDHDVMWTSCCRSGGGLGSSPSGYGDLGKPLAEQTAGDKGRVGLLRSHPGPPPPTDGANRTDGVRRASKCARTATA